MNRIKNSTAAFVLLMSLQSKVITPALPKPSELLHISDDEKKATIYAEKYSWQWPIGGLTLTGATILGCYLYNKFHLLVTIDEEGILYRSEKIFWKDITAIRQEPPSCCTLFIKNKKPQTLNLEKMQAPLHNFLVIADFYQKKSFAKAHNQKFCQEFPKGPWGAGVTFEAPNKILFYSETPHFNFMAGTAVLSSMLSVYFLYRRALSGRKMFTFEKGTMKGAVCPFYSRTIDLKEWNGQGPLIQTWKTIHLQNNRTVGEELSDYLYVVQKDGTSFYFNIDSLNGKISQNDFSLLFKHFHEKR